MMQYMNRTKEKGQVKDINDPNYEDGEEEELLPLSLHDLVEQNKLADLKEFVETEKKKGTTVQVLLEERDLVLKATPLHHAAEFGRTEIAKFLIDSNVRVDPTDHASCTPMHLAAGCGHTAIIKILNDAGAKTSQRDREGNTPLHWACTKGHIEAVKSLVNFGAAIDLQNEEGWTALHRACFNGRNDIVSFMLLKGASIHSVTKRGDTVLHLAASMNRLNTVELLLEGGANPTFQNVDGKYAHEMTINEAVVTTLEEALEKTKTGGMRKKEARGLYKQETLNAEQAAELVRLSLTGGPRRDSKEIDDVFQKIVDKGVAADKKSEAFPGFDDDMTPAGLAVTPGDARDELTDEQILAIRASLVGAREGEGGFDDEDFEETQSQHAGKVGGLALGGGNAMRPTASSSRKSINAAQMLSGVSGRMRTGSNSGAAGVSPRISNHSSNGGSGSGAAPPVPRTSVLGPGRRGSGSGAGAGAPAPPPIRTSGLASGLGGLRTPTGAAAAASPKKPLLGGLAMDEERMKAREARKLAADGGAAAGTPTSSAAQKAFLAKYKLDRAGVFSP